MNGIDELRSTLDRHAADVVDHDLGGRVGSVHHRIGVVRRQRRAAVAGGAALALVAVGAVALLPGRDGGTPEPVTVAGVRVPGTMTSLGYTYAFADGTEGDGKASVDLEASDQPRLVSWATSGDDDLVELAEGTQLTAYDVPDFSDFVWVGPGDSLSLSVTGTGEVGLAVYELTDAAPAGVTGSGVTYRETVGSERLLDAEIGDPGQAEVSVSTAQADGAFSYRYFCANGPENVTLHVELGGGEAVANQVSCAGEVPFDAAGAASYRTSNTPGSDATVRVWLTEGESGPPIDSDDVVLGLGVYDDAASTEHAGFVVPDTLEHDGHLWRASSYQESEPGDRLLEVPSDADPTRPVLAAGYYSAGAAVVEMSYGDAGDGVRAQGVRGGSTVFGVLTDPEATVRLRVLGDVPGDARLLVALFERVD